MSQQLTPISGGVVPEVQTSVAAARLNVLSPQYVGAFGLETRPTQWVPEGRPIYRRLPAISEAYQINFFNVVTESNFTKNNLVETGIEDTGFVYIPPTESVNGPLSLEVASADNKKVLLIKAGAVIWKYGKTEVNPTIVDLSVIDAGVARYDIAYQLVYDDSPISQLYSVSDFALTGQPLTVTSSTDSVVGWRYPAMNAFLNNSNQNWSNEDTFFPSFSQPSSAFLQWESELPSSYASIIMRCPSGTTYSGTATLSYVSNSTLNTVQTVSVSKDGDGQYFEFTISSPVMQTGWNVTFSSNTVSIRSIIVSGTLTLLESQASPSPRATLVMYPAGTLPKTVVNSQGEKISAVYATLAQVDVGVDHKILSIQDTREIVQRDYVPVADWLTEPFDQDLINLYEQVSMYSTTWMAPSSCMMQEYAALEKKQVTVEA